MPNYSYKNESTGEIKEVFQRMDDEHSYYEAGIKWARIFTVPNMDTDTIIDPHSEKDFIRKSKKTRTVGECWDLSAIQSERRCRIEGNDPVKEKAVEAYEKKTKKPHPLKNGADNFNHFDITA